MESIWITWNSNKLWNNPNNPIQPNPVLQSSERRRSISKFRSIHNQKLCTLKHQPVIIAKWSSSWKFQSWNINRILKYCQLLLYFRCHFQRTLFCWKCFWPAWKWLTYFKDFQEAAKHLDNRRIWKWEMQGNLQSLNGVF